MTCDYLERGSGTSTAIKEAYEPLAQLPEPRGFNGHTRVAKPQTYEITIGGRGSNLMANEPLGFEIANNIF